jgi:hypothetical protein
MTARANSVQRTGEEDFAETILSDAARRFVARRRERVDAFVDRHFSLGGTLALHRHALGWDLVRAPLNLFLTLPTLAAKLASRVAQRAGHQSLANWLASRHFMFETDLARQIEWLVATELLETPCIQRDRASLRDALAETILADPRVAVRLDATSGSGHEHQPRLATAIESYKGSRVATAEVATGVMATGLGALLVKQITPGLVTLGSAIAATIAQQTAIATFPLGAGLGALWYGWFPAAADPGLIAATTCGVLVGGTLLAAFSGIVTDPIKRRLGLHRRRLFRLLSEIEQALCGENCRSVSLRDYYLARLIDILDLVASAWRVAGYPRIA